MKKLTFAIAAVTALSLAGCEEKKSAPAPTAPSATVAELSDDDVPVAEDYVEEATKEIDEANYKAQLDAVEKDITSGKE